MIGGSLSFDSHSILDCFTLAHLGEGDRLARKVREARTGWQGHVSTMTLPPVASGSNLISPATHWSHHKSLSGLCFPHQQGSWYRELDFHAEGVYLGSFPKQILFFRLWNILFFQFHNLLMLKNGRGRNPISPAQVCETNNAASTEP